jgi:hypothetical protein
MLAVAHAADLSAAACEFDNRRTVCPEDWEMRQLSILEATAKPLDWHQRIGVDGLDIPTQAYPLHRFGRLVHLPISTARTARCGKRSRSSRPVGIALRPMRELRSIPADLSAALVDEDIQDDFQRSPTPPVARPGIRKVGA